MNLISLKLDFFNYLEKEGKTDGLKEDEILSSDLSIFMYSSEFEKFMDEKGSEYNLPEDFSGSISDILEMEFDEETGEFKTGEDDENSLMGGLLNELFKNEDVLKATDIDHDGKISQDEMTNFIQLANQYDKDDKNFTLKDIFGAVKGIEDGTFNPSYGIIPTELSDPAALAMQQALSTNAANNTDGGNTTNSTSGTTEPKNNSFNTQNSGPAATPTPSKGATEESENKAKEIEEIDRQIAEKTNEINSLTSEKANAYSANSEYQTLTNDLKTVNDTIAKSSSNITTLETDLHKTQTDISAKQAELDNLQDPKVFTEYKEQIDAKRNELKSAIESLKTKESETQQKIETEKQTITTNEQKQATLEGQIKEFEQNNPNDQIKEINSKIETLKSDISSLKEQKQQKQTEIKQTRDQEKSDAEVYGKATAYRQSEFVKYMMDYATDSGTRNRYDSANHGGAWCAIFTSEVTEKLYAEVAKRLGMSTNQSQDLGGNQMAMHATAWGKMVQNALSNAGIKQQATINISHMTEQQRKDAVRNGLIYPGMTFEYEEGGHYHTGFIESINPDLTWNTIEGNSTGGKTGQNRRDATYSKLTSVTDSTLKTMYWLVQRGIITAEEANRRLYGA